MAVADPRLLAEARALLAGVTPLPFDCGTLCGHRCCTDFAPNVGVYLLPGEIDLFDGSEDWLTWQRHSPKKYEFAPAWDKFKHVPFIQCHRLCDRERRPFECRTYPLVPYLRAGGELEMRYSPWAAGVCPLAATYPLAGLQPEFVAAARQAWTVLMQDPDLAAHVRWLSAQMDAAAAPGAAPGPADPG